METELIKMLNKVLSQEHACAIRYATHAAVVTGPYAEVISARLKEISGDEIAHAEILRDRIISLGGTPTMAVSVEDLTPADNLADILAVNMAEEAHAIRAYTEILAKIPEDNIILLQAIEDIIRDEQEHMEELKNLVS